MRSPVLGNHGILSNDDGDDASLSETVVAGSEVGAALSESVVSFGGSLKGTPKILKKAGELTVRTIAKELLIPSLNCPFSTGFTTFIIFI